MLLTLGFHDGLSVSGLNEGSTVLGLDEGIPELGDSDKVGSNVGELDGILLLGLDEGRLDKLGLSEICTDGASDNVGALDGLSDGNSDKGMVGLSEYCKEGDIDGKSLGVCVGSAVGALETGAGVAGMMHSVAKG